jgi:hypothetical protein
VVGTLVAGVLAFIDLRSSDRKRIKTIPKTSKVVNIHSGFLFFPVQTISRTGRETEFAFPLPYHRGREGGCVAGGGNLR